MLQTIKTSTGKEVAIEVTDKAELKSLKNNIKLFPDFDKLNEDYDHGKYTGKELNEDIIRIGYNWSSDAGIEAYNKLNLDNNGSGGYSFAYIEKNIE